jgi:hypothetical protein
MKSLDLISKRILVISLSISSVLLCASLLIFAARPAKAQSPSFPSRMDDGRRYDAIAGTVGVGGGVTIAAGNAYSYFFIWNTQTGTYRMVHHLSGDDNLSEKNW